MGVYAFIFGCIGLGILLWIISALLGEYLDLNETIVKQIGDAGSIMFVIGLISLAVVFLIRYFQSGHHR